MIVCHRMVIHHVEDDSMGQQLGNRQISIM
jgi:hypothetical protein